MTSATPKQVRNSLLHRGIAAPDAGMTWALTVLVMLGTGWVLTSGIAVPPDQQRLREAAWALVGHRYEQARTLAQAVLQVEPHSTRALLIAGDAASGLQLSEEALADYRRIPEDGGVDRLLAHRGAGLREFRLGRVAEAERDLRRVLNELPDDVETHAALARLLLQVGRSWDALPHQLALLQEGQFNGNRLLEIASIEIPSKPNHQFIEDCLGAAPRDLTPLLARARVAVFRRERLNAESLLRRIVAEAPGSLDAQAQLGRLLVDSPEFFDWQAHLPPNAEQHPEIWVTKGLWAKQQGQLRAAARCFGEALRLYPDHQMACHHLALTMNALGEKENARVLAERAAKLELLQSLFSTVTDGTPIVRRIAETLESLGRRWEAAAWSYAAFRSDATLVWAQRDFERLTGRLEAKAVLTSAEANPATWLDLSRYPLPTWQRAGVSKSELAQSGGAESCPVRFVDRAAEVGLNFRHYNGADAEKRFAYMYEYSGGGVAVLDYDGDGWPDIYLTQGCPWPLQPDQAQYRDRLFRNLGNGQFEDVTEAAQLGDNGLSQGVTVGDYNQDGFPDLYVANIGASRFYHNNGDGTFRDITEQTGTAANVWCSSCALADLNGDAFPDLYCVTYLGGPEVFVKKCETDGRPVQCAPHSFPAERDRVYLNLGDGRFREVTEECGAAVPEGKGLGVVVADFDGSHRLGLFVSNDTTPNFFFENHTEKAGGPLELVENALFRGLAYDATGSTRACMGVAVADVNDNGWLDILVTNFYRESVYLFAQQEDHTFIQSEREAGLERPTHEMLSWGTQFLDGELDGHLDLVVASGHINDFSHMNLPYRMRPKYFHNRGKGRFAEIPAETLGDYYRHEYLGRAIARLDWNRDGLEDYCTTHVDAPVALLTNATAEHGNYLAVRLIGTTSSRDAIGTTLRVKAGKRTWIRQLTAGDGFYASNERQLIVGLGQETTVEELIVEWPSGGVQVFPPPEVNSQVNLVEGCPDAISAKTR